MGMLHQLPEYKLFEAAYKGKSQDVLGLKNNPADDQTVGIIKRTAEQIKEPELDAEGIRIVLSKWLTGVLQTTDNLRPSPLI